MSVVVPVVLIGVVAACGDDPAPSLHAMVVRPEFDTVRFVVPAAVRRCSDGTALLLRGSDESGNGVLVRLRYGDSLIAGAFPLLMLGDSITPRGANVGVRYMKGDVARGVALDSGAVYLTRTDDALAARVRASGLEGSVRVQLDAAYEALSLSADTTACRFLP